MINIAKIKKINNAWQPSENRELKVGEIVDITDYMKLVKTGMGVLVDENGQELPLPGEVFTCPICYKRTETLLAFTSHVGEKHSSVKPSVTIAEESKPVSALEQATQTRDEQIYTQRVEALAKTRATAKANREGAKA